MSVGSVSLIFLEIDGVLIDRSNERVIGQIAYEKELLREMHLDVGYSDHIVYLRAAARSFSVTATAYLKELIDRVNKEARDAIQSDVEGSVAIVISSSFWKKNVNFATLKNYVFADVFFRDLIIDKTPDSDFGFKSDLSKTASELSLEKYGFSLKNDTGREIDFWLRENYQNLKIKGAEKWKLRRVLILSNSPYSEIWVRYASQSLQIGVTLLSQEDVDQGCKILREVPFSSASFLSEASVQIAIEERNKYWNKECVIS